MISLLLIANFQHSEIYYLLFNNKGAGVKNKVTRATNVKSYFQFLIIFL